MSIKENRWQHLALFFLCVAVASCGGIFGSGGEEFLATIEDGEALPLSIEVPTNVRQGQAFEVRIQTYPNKTCEEKGPTRVTAEERGVLIVPFDRIVEGENCPDVAQTVTHTAEVKFERRGMATVFVRGVRRVNPGDGSEVDTIVVERTVQIE